MQKQKPAFLPLRRPYPSRHGAPVVVRVDPAIFVQTYFTQCLQCAFCQDACCTYGACVDLANVERLVAHAEALEAYLGRPRSQWLTGKYVRDAESAGGSYTRTQVVAGACVFLNRRGRGCLLQTWCDTVGLDHHLLKPLVCSLFPLTVAAGVLRPALEVREESLVCLGQGGSLYHGVREEVRYYFGAECVAELDQLAAGLPPEG
ncbi:MAG: hypothetical protein KatS3mg131_1550 [Candidatus Tectimicrobiota bacterium]|nr:MAG: hypothetical protein KatS3mg131_1550 [Candidatus Tectomicrobia bacterium]